MKRFATILFSVLLLFSFSALASSVGIIGGADGPTAVFVAGEGFLSRLLALIRFLLGFFLK